MAEESDAAQPHTIEVVPPMDAMHYTDPAQLPAFREKINTIARRDAGVSLNENNEIVWWGGSYRMPLGYWLLDGRIIYDGDIIREFYRPVLQWSQQQETYFDEHPTFY